MESTKERSLFEGAMPTILNFQNLFDGGFPLPLRNSRFPPVFIIHRKRGAMNTLSKILTSHDECCAQNLVTAHKITNRFFHMDRIKLAFYHEADSQIKSCFVRSALIKEPVL